MLSGRSRIDLAWTLLLGGIPCWRAPNCWEPTSSTPTWREPISSAPTWGEPISSTPTCWEPTSSTPTWGAKLQHANLWRADLQHANLWRADLQRAHLWGAKLQHAFLREADLQHADLSGADLLYAILLGADLQHALLQRADLTRVSLLDARSIERIHLYRATLDHTQLRKRQLGGAIGEEEAEWWFEAKETYLALKNNWEQTGRYDDASWAYRKERRVEKATKAPWRCRKYFDDEKPFPSSMRRLLGHLSPGAYEGLPRWSPLVWWFWLKYTGKWLTDWFVELLCDYGESIGRVLFWMAASLSGFAACYWRVGGIRLTDPASGSQATATSFWHYLIYSAGAFTTTIFAKYQPACDQVRLVTALQAIVGIFLAGLLGNDGQP